VRVLFSSLPHAAGSSRLYYLRRGLLPSFIAAARELNERGWALRVEDAFRTRYMQKHLALRPDIFDKVLSKVAWELEGRRPGPELLRRRLAALVAMNPKVGTHTSGSAIDVSVVQLADGAEVDRGAPYIELSEKTPMDSPFVSAGAQANRREITALMARHGFVTYPFEFWHYNAGDALEGCLNGSRAPARYGPVDFDPATGEVSPLADPTAALNSLQEIGSRAEAFLRDSRDP
jgi:D-alanyl-D-alanine dipeptidase